MEKNKQSDEFWEREISFISSTGNASARIVWDHISNWRLLLIKLHVAFNIEVLSYN